MFRVLAAIVMLAAPAGAECFGPDRQPRKVTFDSGEAVRILSRKGDTLRYAQDLGTVGRVEDTTHGALVPLQSKVQGETFVHTWDQPLPRIADLRPGQRLTLTGRISGGMEGRVALAIRVLGAETLTLGGCRYDTLVIETVMKVNGAVVATVRRYLHPGTLMVLASVAENPGGADPSRAQMARVAVRID
jgi:hypothetical protein